MSSSDQSLVWDDRVVAAVLAGLATLLLLAVFAYLWVWKLDDLCFYRCIVPWRIWRLERSLPERQEHTKERFETVDRWLIKKTVQSQEECGCVGDNSSSVLSGNDDCDRDESSRKFLECGICLQELRADGQRTVGISVVCQHAFCFDCIRKWLVSHKTCPECREVYLPIDNGAPGREYLDKSWSFLPGLEEHNRLVGERRTREECSTFCEREGLLLMDDEESQRQKRGDGAGSGSATDSASGCAAVSTTTKHSQESQILESQTTGLDLVCSDSDDLEGVKPFPLEKTTEPTCELTIRPGMTKGTLLRRASLDSTLMPPNLTTESTLQRQQSWP
mmetsp:Transcript_5703/g.8049  ORF Transcript_5703/g.8049 Transcript_5703/m.8049 type:complete len:333 (-) Transcript_5703:417-1415(-)